MTPHRIAHIPTAGVAAVLIPAPAVDPGIVAHWLARGGLWADDLAALRLAFPDDLNRIRRTLAALRAPAHRGHVRLASCPHVETAPVEHPAASPGGGVLPAGGVA